MNVLPLMSGVTFYWRFISLVITAFLFAVSLPSSASASADVVISGISSAVSTSSEEFIQIANIGDDTADISNVQIVLKRSSAASPVVKYALAPPENVRYLLPSSKRALFVSSSTFNSKISDATDFVPDGIFIAGTTSLANVGGIVELRDEQNNLIDAAYWGDTIQSGKELSTGTSLALNDENILVQISGIDFPLEFGGIVEQETIRDLCPALDDIQITLPDGYGYDEAGNCEQLSSDICPNMDLIQLVLSSGYVHDDSGNCVDASLDVCPSLSGFQYELPIGHRFVGSECMVTPLVQPLRLSELLPNVAGTDAGKEFIELYHTGAETVDLSDYYLKIGKSAEKLYPLPSIQLNPGGYVAMWGSEVGYSLLNTTTQVELYFYDGTLLDAIIPYQSPKEDISWALIDDVWQFTNNVTPGSVNVGPTEEDENDVPRVESSSLNPCPEGKYRHPLTNRCRTIESDVAVLAACEADEYRNPDTNRCRKITQAMASLTPCQPGYERNPDTNRCRKITSDESDLVPCKDGYERNPETNRCRKVISTELASASELDSEAGRAVVAPKNMIDPYALAALAGFGAITYGTYEWRTELSALSGRASRLFKRK